MSKAAPGLILIFACLILNLVCYLFLTPQPSPHWPKRWATYPRLGSTLHLLAYCLALLRLPFTLLPYLTKLITFLLLRNRFQAVWNSYPGQAVRVLGDFINFGLTFITGTMLLSQINDPFFDLIFCLTLAAEFIRLLAEKGQMVISALWQALPHRRLAHALDHQTLPLLQRYCRYYSLPDEARITYLVQLLKCSAATDPEADPKLAYFQTWTIVADHINLRTGHVRDVAVGRIFIHRWWTNDPWLLIGQALRRSPWIFDPRYLRRPFYYRTEANPLVTRFVLNHAPYSPPYAWYQFGHEIKAARYELFYRCCRRVGLPLEEPIRADGQHNFDPIIRALANRLGLAQPDQPQRPLWTDTEVYAALNEISPAEPALAALAIARRYTYPLKYVEEVLLPQLYRRPP